MCEVFAMSSRYPANISFSLDEFARHGGASAPHKDGWGIAFYDGRDLRRIREPDSAARSPCIEFIKSHKYPSNMVISHLRMATSGPVCLRNTQPFSREMGGRMHLFAHNGDLPNIHTRQDLPLSIHRPIGDTDSELAFCHLMHLLRGIWLDEVPPDLSDRYLVLTTFASRIRSLGSANFIYSDGEYLFVHGDKRSQPGREGFHPPGLHWICRTCIPGKRRRHISGITLTFGSGEQKVALAASVPLTDERWNPLSEGEFRIFKAGENVPLPSSAAG